MCSNYVGAGNKNSSAMLLGQTGTRDSTRVPSPTQLIGPSPKYGEQHVLFLVGIGETLTQRRQRFARSCCYTISSFLCSPQQATRQETVGHGGVVQGGCTMTTPSERERWEVERERNKKDLLLLVGRIVCVYV